MSMARRRRKRSRAQSPHRLSQVTAIEPSPSPGNTTASRSRTSSLTSSRSAGDFPRLTGECHGRLPRILLVESAAETAGGAGHARQFASPTFPGLSPRVEALTMRFYCRASTATRHGLPGVHGQVPAGEFRHAQAVPELPASIYSRPRLDFADTHERAGHRYRAIITAARRRAIICVYIFTSSLSSKSLLQDDVAFNRHLFMMREQDAILKFF